jgi:hypothetical protein
MGGIMDREKLEELRTRGECGGDYCFGIMLEPEERDALFAYIDDLERQLREQDEPGAAPYPGYCGRQRESD